MGNFGMGLLQAQEQGGGEGGGSGLGGYANLLLPIGIFVIFYLLLIRPQQKQAKERQKMLTTLEKGQDVLTTGGIHGRIVGVAENVLTLEIGDGVKIKIERSGIQGLRKT